MVNILFSPRWFWGIDALFESVAILATALLAFYAYRLYKFTKKSSHKYFSLSFLTLSLAFLAKVITNILLYFPSLRKNTIDFLLLKYYILSNTNLIYAAGNLVYRFMMLLGLLGILWVIGKAREKNKLLILLYFISAVSFVSIFAAATSYFILELYPIFHITAALFLAYISYFYYDNFIKKRKNTTLGIFLSFLLIFLSQIIFIFVLVDLRIYVIAELLQLAGYFLLLYEYYTLTRKK